MSVSATVIRDNTRQIGNSAARYPRHRFCPVCSPISFITRQYLKKRKKEKEWTFKKRERERFTWNEGRNIVPLGEYRGGQADVSMDGGRWWWFVTLSRRGNLSNRDIYNCRTFALLNNDRLDFYLFIYFSIINEIWYLSNSQRGYLFVITSSCSNGRIYIYIPNEGQISINPLHLLDWFSANNIRIQTKFNSSFYR